MGQGHGWEGAVLKLLRAKDFVFTVTGAEDVTPHYRRVHLTDGGMLAVTGIHPTMWVRLWFDSAGKPHQRAYTLVDPDPAAGTFSLEFALHEGRASDWARTAQPGATVEATVHGTGFTDPDPAPSHVLAIGDPASLPALNSLLAALPTAPATVWFETTDGTDGLPLSVDPDRHDLRPVPRLDGGAHLVEQVRAGAPDLLRGTSDPYVWIACDTVTTRSLTAYFRKELALPKQRVNALGYWRAT
ncbi:siderophore-interacting protein [Streptomyces poonensis]|uniref:Siderophore-interacting protein n=1 Tax=Streptomyces poonensis TaxID=68255 RepID=A0A918UNJ1_9ACTN|nr:siderophore-interacting protein [Streptomyces poonensis]GGZ24577.1 siderophore-interacting protein [Streptomyces poonensis]GLJ89999.1 siderophore-interacting protein [Streptomyces poonensis]